MTIHCLFDQWYIIHKIRCLSLCMHNDDSWPLVALYVGTRIHRMSVILSTKHHASPHRHRGALLHVLHHLQATGACELKRRKYGLHNTMCICMCIYCAFMYIYIYMCVCVSVVYLYTYMYICVCVSIYLSIYLSIFLTAPSSRFIHLSISLPIHLFSYLSS